MQNYKLSNTAENDLVRIYHWGFERYGQAQADQYFAAFFDHFELLAEQRYHIRLPIYAKATGVVYVAQIACITESVSHLDYRAILDWKIHRASKNPLPSLFGQIWPIKREL